MAAKQEVWTLCFVDDGQFTGVRVYSTCNAAIDYLKKLGAKPVHGNHLCFKMPLGEVAMLSLEIVRDE